jgi:KaiC/GvpD/RAD55 family RecA-like ATPase
MFSEIRPAHNLIVPFCELHLSQKTKEAKEEQPSSWETSLTPDMVLDRISRTKSADKFNKLMDGDNCNLPSDSEGDLAACNILVWACGQIPDAQVTEIINHVFRNSKRHRKKWDTVHRPEDNSTYGQMTIEKALADTTARWTPQEKKQPFPFLSIGELTREPMVIEWLIRNYIPKNSIITIYGESGEIKTFTVISMAISMLTGRKWFGIDVKKVDGPIFIICGEGFHGMAARLRAAVIDAGVDAHKLPLYVSGIPVQILEENSVQAMLEAIDGLTEKHGQPEKIILDTMARCFGPGNENDTADMSRYISTLDKVRAKYGCSILNIHHSGLGAKDRSRGSSAHRAALDMEFRVERHSDNIRKIVCTKSKDSEPPADIYVEPEVVPLDWFDPETGEELTSIVLRKVDAPEGTAKGKAKLTGSRRIALDVLKDLGRKAMAEIPEDEKETVYSFLNEYGPVHLEDWREAAYSVGISTSTDTSARRKAFSRAVTALMDGEYITCENDFYVVT